MSITIKLDEHTSEDVKAIQIMREFGFSEEEIQEKYNEQKLIDESNK